MAVNLRYVLIILAAVVLAAAGGIYFYTNRSQEVMLEDAPDAASASPSAAVDEALMVAGPLGEQALGDANAPNVVIEYSSLTCSHCQRFHSETFGPFKEKYIDTGKVYYIMREFPLDPVATSAIMLARCAPDERYFPMLDLLFEHQVSWAFVVDPLTALRDLVKQAGFSQESLNSCLTNQEILDGVNWVRDRGMREFGVDSVPTFFFNGEKVVGALSLADIDLILGD